MLLAKGLCRRPLGERCLCCLHDKAAHQVPPAHHGGEERSVSLSINLQMLTTKTLPDRRAEMDGCMQVSVPHRLTFHYWTESRTYLVLRISVRPERERCSLPADGDLPKAL
jgi:hypothetical protein